MHFKENPIPLVQAFYSGSGPAACSSDGMVLYSCSISMNNIPSIHATILDRKYAKKIVTIETDDEDVPIVMEAINDLLFVSFRISNSIYIYRCSLNSLSSENSVNIHSSDKDTVLSLETDTANEHAENAIDELINPSLSLILIQTLKAHSDSPVIGMVANKNFLLTSSTDRNIRIWGIDTDDHLSLINTIRTGIICSSMNLLGDGNILITTSTDGIVRLWDSSTTKPLCSPMSIFSEGESIAATILLNEFSILLIALRSGIIFFWDITKKILLKRMVLPDINDITCILFINHVLFIGSSDSIRAYLFSADFTLNYLNHFSFGCHRMLCHGSDKVVLLGLSSLPIVQVISFDSMIIDKLKCQSVTKHVDFINTEIQTIGDSGEITDIAIDNVNENIILASSLGVLVTIKRFERKFIDWPVTNKGVTSSPIMVLSKITPNGLFVSGSKDSSLILWTISPSSDIQMLSHILNAHGMDSSISGVAFGGTKIYSIGSDGFIRQWTIDRASYEIVLESSITGHGSDAILSLDYDMKNSLLITGSQDKTARIWDVSEEVLSPTLRNSLSGHKRSVWSVSFSQNRLAVTGSADLTIRVWNVHSGVLLSVLGGPGSDGTHLGSVLRVAFYHPQSKLDNHPRSKKMINEDNSEAIIISTGSDGLIKVWNWSKRTCIATLELNQTSSIKNEQKLWSLAVAPDNSIVTGGGIIFEDVSSQLSALEHASKAMAISAEQALVNAIALGHIKEAVRLAIIQDQPFKLLSLFRSFVGMNNFGPVEGNQNANGIIPASSISPTNSATTADVLDAVVEVVESNSKHRTLLIGWLSKWITRQADASLCQCILNEILNRTNCYSSTTKELENILPYSEKLYERTNDGLSSLGAIDAILHTISS